MLAVSSKACSAPSLTSRRVSRAGTVRAAAPSRMAVRARASQERPRVELPVGVSLALATAMANPLVAQAAATPSLRNFLGSIVSGGLILAVLFAALGAVSSFDTVKR